MKEIIMSFKKVFFAVAVIGLAVVSCKKEEVSKNIVLDVASKQYDMLYDSIQAKKGDVNYIPRSIREGSIRYVSSYDWTSGFYAGSLWYLYDLTGESRWKDRATEYTIKMDSVQYYSGNHDIGFMMEGSYGKAIQFTGNKKYESVIVQSAKSLIKRFEPKAGIIRSWDVIAHYEEGMWECPVIIDNMMNLELLFHATKISGDSIYANVAISHANNTLENHFRSDNSSYHVVDYDAETGAVLQKTTHQGFADDSDWARGQTWGLYGFTSMYKETKDVKYLEQAIKIASFIKNHPNMPEDQVPYWDYDVEITDTTSRDASAAAIAASGLLELQKYVDSEKSKEYVTWAKQILNSLSSPAYLAKVGTNKGFILEHSAGVIPYNSEVDVPLNYADYYYLEALSRLKAINK